MDLMQGLSAVSAGLGIVKELRDLDRSVDEAAFKLKLAELTSSLADAKFALVDAKERSAELKNKISELTNGTRCPICRIGRINVVKNEPAFGSGVEHHYCECQIPECEYKTTKLFDSSLGVYASQLKS